MTDTPIEPALTPEEWAARRVEFVGLPGLVFHDDGDRMELVARGDDGTTREKWKFNLAPDLDLPALIALANAALPDDDPAQNHAGMGAVASHLGPTTWRR